MANKWDSLSKADRAKLLAGAGLPTGLAQLNWSGLQKSERKKLEKGKGWFEAKEPIMTAKGIEHKAPEHHRVAVKKEAGKALNKRMERKEPIASKKPKEEKLSERRYKEWYDKGFAEAGKKNSIYKDVKSIEEDIEMVKESNRTPAPEVYAGIPNLSGLESLAKLEGIRDGLIAKAKKAQEQKEAADSSGKEYAVAFLRKNPIPLSDIEYYKGRALNRHNPHAISDLVWQEAWKKVGRDGEIMITDSEGEIYDTPYSVDEVVVNQKYVKDKTVVQSQGIKLDSDEEKFIKGIYKQISEGATVKEFGTRLYVWKDDEAYATKHITDSEYMVLKAIIKGVHQLSRADALKNLKEGREKEGTIAQEIEERNEQERLDAEFNKLNLKAGDVLYSKHNGTPFTYIGTKGYSTDKGTFGLEEHYSKYKFEQEGGEVTELFKDQVLGLLSKNPKEAPATEHKAQETKEAGMTPSKLKDKMFELNKVYNNFRQKYGRSGVKKETQRQALADFERLGREIADDMAKQLGFNNLSEVPNFGLRNKLRGLYDPNTFMEDTDRFLKQIEIKVKEAKLPVKGMAGQGV